MRRDLGLSASGLGQKIGTDKGTISRMERGKAGISAERLQRIANALDRSVDELLGNGDESHSGATGS